jgi:hypothetical protein
MARKGKDLAKKMRALIAHAEAQGWAAELRRGGHWKLTPPQGKGAVFLAQSPSDWRAVKNNISIMRRYGYDPDFQEDEMQSNPNSMAHREFGLKQTKEAQKRLEAADKARESDPAKALNLYLDTIVLAGVALQEGEHGKGKGRQAAWALHEIRTTATRIAEAAREGVRDMITSKNPADIPGGSMSGCIAIMEARPDVESPGALCNWLARRSGESFGGIRLPRRKGKSGKKKGRMSPSLRKALRGT